jgi:hypothetical protein
LSLMVLPLSMIETHGRPWRLTQPATKLAEAHGNRTHPSRQNRDANGFEVREGHQTPGASARIISESRL